METPQKTIDDLDFMIVLLDSLPPMGRRPSEADYERWARLAEERS